MAKNRTKFHEVLCFCAVRPDLHALLDRLIAGEEYLGGLDGILSKAEVDKLQRMLKPHLKLDGSTLAWCSDPPIEVVEEFGKHAKARAEAARDVLSDIVESQPYAWFAQSPALVNELHTRLARCLSVVRLRWPDVETKPVSQAAFWLCHALAFGIRERTEGVVMLRDGTFVAGNDELVQR
jgi:hypothetical protein